jgi:hypothetical protein
MSALAVLHSVADDPSTKPRVREEARAAITLFSYLELNSEHDLIVFLLGQCAGLQERIDQLECRG